MNAADVGTLVSATNTMLTLLGTVANLTAQAQQITALIQKANAEGRSTFSADEWAVITGADDAARQVLVDSIAKALRS